MRGLKGSEGEREKTRLTRDRPRRSRLVTRAKPLAQLCIYTNVHSMGSKHKELEAIVQQESYAFAIMETRWDDSHDWSAAVDTYKPFRKHGQSRRGGGVEKPVPVGKDQGKVSRQDIMVVGVCYIPPNQDKQTEEAFYKQLAEVSWFQSLG